MLQAGKDVTILRKRYRELAKKHARKNGIEMRHSQKQIEQAFKKIETRRSTRRPIESKMKSNIYKGEPALK